MIGIDQSPDSCTTCYRGPQCCANDLRALIRLCEVHVDQGIPRFKIRAWEPGLDIPFARRSTDGLCPRGECGARLRSPVLIQFSGIVPLVEKRNGSRVAAVSSS